MSDSALWYVSRGTGVAVLLVLTVAVVLGVLTRQGQAPSWIPRFVVAGVHRNASLLALVLLAVHIVTIVSDTFSKVGWVDTVVPFGSDFRPFWVGLGTIAMELFVAVVVTSLLRHALGRRSWKVVHLAVYAAWLIALAHGLGTGRDVGQVWMLAITALCIASFVAATGYRVAARPAQLQPEVPAPQPIGVSV